jgi:hypothetical protein
VRFDKSPIDVLLCECFHRVLPVVSANNWSVPASAGITPIMQAQFQDNP